MLGDLPLLILEGVKHVQNRIGYFGIVLILLLAVMTCYLLFPKKNLPPGPWPLPVIGNAHQIRSQIHLKLTKMSAKYGPVMFLRLGSKPLIVISDAAIAREALVTKGTDFANRVDSLILRMGSRQKQGIISGDYTKAWQFHRKVAHKALHMFGDGMQKLEKKILGQIQVLCDFVRSKHEQGVVLDDSIKSAVLNVVCDIVFGNTYNVKDPEFISIQEVLCYFASRGKTYFAFEAIPLVGTLLARLSWTATGKFLKIIAARDAILEKKFDSIKATFKDGCVTNYVEALLQAKVDLEKEQNSSLNYMTHDRTIMSMSDIMLAGYETTSTAIRWAVLYLATWPNVQEKTYQEITKVVGEHGEHTVVNLQHRKLLPYTEATLMEVMRLSSLSYMSLIHSARVDTTLNGYDIPKDSLIAFNLWAIHHDEKTWHEPFDFKPERFLDESGALIREQSRAYLPFSAGPRSCLGETLAKAELFLFVANLVHKFQFCFVPGEENPTLSGICGATLSPKAFKVFIRSRMC